MPAAVDPCASDDSPPEPDCIPGTYDRETDFDEEDLLCLENTGRVIVTCQANGYGDKFIYYALDKTRKTLEITFHFNGEWKTGITFHSDGITKDV